MKKLFFLIIVFLTVSFSAFSQSYESSGDKAYIQGNYEEAIVQYQAALALLDARKVNSNSPEYLKLERKLTRAQNCLPLLKKAESLFHAAETNPSDVAYSNAKAAYQEILRRNSDDKSARKYILECDSRINILARNKEDEALWNKMTGSRVGYESYLEEFPDGLHSQEARSALAKIEDEQLWFKARSENTVAAYERYMSETKTSEHMSEAKYAIAIIHDDNKWALLKDGNDEAGLIAYINDTSNITKQYIDKANAYLTVIRTKRYAMTADADPRQIVNDLSKAQETILLDDESKRILEEKMAIVDYEDFIDNPTIAAGERYLERYPEGFSIYRDRVANKVAIMYADSFTMTSTFLDYDKAINYAVDSNTKNYVENKFNAISKKRRISKRRDAWKERCQLGVGLDFDFDGVKNFVYGPRVEFKLGSASDVFNFSLGAKYLMWNAGKPDSEGGADSYIPKVGVDQVPLFATLKFNMVNLGKANVCKLYLAAEGSYNLNINSKFKAPDKSSWSSYDDNDFPGLWQGEVVKDSRIVNKNNITAVLRVGFNWRKFDLAFFGKYDVTPMFNTAYLANEPGYAYDVISSSVNNRMRYGFSLIYFFIL